MSTGWFDNTKSCFRWIRIFHNNTNVTAQVIDVCNSSEGCTQQLQYHPPCGNDIISATNPVWKALGVIKEDSEANKMDITWKFEDTGSPPSPFAKENNTRNGKNNNKNHNSRTRKIIVIIAAIFGSTLGFLSMLVCMFFAYKWWKKKVQDWRNDRVLMGTREALPRQFEYGELQTATQNFRTTLGSGGYGCVYKGVLADGTEIAVKRMEGANEGERQFIAEVMSVGSIHHVNLVRLRGFCIHIPYYMLVYEFMCNGSLDKWIFMDENKPTLDWKKRFNIAVEVARGLSYLHDGCRERVLHLDLKPQNILLDGDFKPKIADFGLAKLVAKNGSVTATGVRGTIGYMAPEWLQSRVTDKTDIYSFGVVLLEIVSGKRPFGTFQSLQLNSDLSVATLGDFVQAKVKDGNLINAIDTCLLPAADPSFKLHEVERVVRVGMLCIQDEPHQRPSITDALKMLDGSLTIEHKITCST